MRKSLLFLLLCGGAIFHNGCLFRQHEELPACQAYDRPAGTAPYILKITLPRGELLYYGTFHTVNPGSAIIRDIARRWEAFKPSLVLSEGGVRPLEKSRREAVCIHGEQGWLRFLADRQGVPIKSIEPRRIREVYRLLKEFDPVQIKIFYILRQAAVNRMLNRESQTVREARFLLSNLLKLKEFRGHPRNLEELVERVYRLFPRLTDWRRVPEEWFGSTPKGGWLNRMSRVVSHYRNRHMIRMVMRELKKGNRIFAVVGRSHVVQQEPVLRSLLANP